jgi:hypothetical protein
VTNCQRLRLIKHLAAFLGFKRKDRGVLRKARKVFNAFFKAIKEALCFVESAEPNYQSGFNSVS